MNNLQTHDRLKIFVSYSRNDTAFVDELVAGLELAGFAPFVDKKDIAPGELWEDRLQGLILSADTIIFVISPESVSSSRCAWELSESDRLGKRILPIVWRRVPDEQVPYTLNRRNYVFFEEGRSFTQALTELSRALRTDLEWVREHTRLSEIAARWRMRGQGSHLLLKGKDIDDADAWLGRAPKAISAPTQELIEFIQGSRSFERGLRRHKTRVRVTIGALALTSIAAMIYVVSGNQTYFHSLAELAVEKFNTKVLNADAESSLKSGDTFSECGSCPEMVVIPTGQFLMGSPDSEVGRSSSEGPPRIVSLTYRLAVSKYEITIDQWDACQVAGECVRTRSGFQRVGRNPICCINWFEAKQYVAWLSKRTGRNYRLLSEAEWEYAARAGSGERYSWGDTIGVGNANCNGCGSQWDGRQAAPVGSFRPNAFGLYDMHGNVSEWVEDAWSDSYAGAPIDGSPRQADAQGQDRVRRGGSWSGRPFFLRSADRRKDSADNRGQGIGFRVARTLGVPH